MSGKDDAAGPMSSEEMKGKLLSGSYRLEREVGQGGMGEVYEAQHLPLGRRVAVKVLHPHLASDPVLLERFRREAEAAAGLGHPNIVQVTDFCHQPEEPVFMVLEYLSGWSLKECLDSEQRLEPTRAAFIASQVLSALEATHAAGIVHRDLKPANVFLTEISGVRDIVKVLDFGIAKLTGDATATQVTRTGAVVGTPAYMSPEQARGREVDHRADIYAVGATLYRMLTGSDPFSAPNFNAMMFAITDHEPLPIPELSPEVPAGLVAVVERAMQKDPADRYQQAGEMRAALQPFSRTSVPSREAELLAGLTPATEPGPGEPSDTIRDRGARPLPDTIVNRAKANAPEANAPEAGAPAPAGPDPDPSATDTSPAAPREAPRGALWMVWIGALAFVAALTALLVWHYSGRQQRSAQAPQPPPPAPDARPAAAARAPATPDAARALSPDARVASKAPPPRAKKRPRPATRAAPRRKPRPARLTARYSGCNANYLYSASHLRRLLTAVQGRVGACLTPGTLERIRGRSLTYRLGLDPGGRVLGGRAVGLHPASPATNRCVYEVLRGIDFGPTRSGTGGRIEAWFQVLNR
jgi:serine/threonine protein kinase